MKTCREVLLISDVIFHECDHTQIDRLFSDIFMIFVTLLGMFCIKNANKLYDDVILLCRVSPLYVFILSSLCYFCVCFILMVISL